MIAHYQRIDLMQTIFKLKDDAYKRDINPIRHYVEQMASVLSKRYNKPIDYCEKYLVSKIKDKGFPGFKNPEVTYFYRQDNGDRCKKTTSLNNYIRSVEKDNLIMVASGTCYLNHKETTSVLVGFLEETTASRSKHKALSFKLKAANDIAGYNKHTKIQLTKKRHNNSVSGAFASRGTVLFNPSAHYTLTSTTRTTTAISNGNNERLVGGNRHYRNSNIAINNIISITSRYDAKEFKAVVDKYNLHIVTTAEVMDVVKKCSVRYWRNDSAMAGIESVVNNLSSLDKTFYMYCGDLYHVRKYNSDLIRTLFTELSREVEATEEHKISDFEPYVINLAHHICSDLVKGMGTNYELMEENNVLNTVLGTCSNIENILRKYRDLFKAIIVTDHLPPSVAYIRDMIRSVVPLSDTDSSCVSYYEWADWFLDGFYFSPKTTAFTASIMTVATQSIKHLLNKFSLNMNVDRKYLGVLDMKNEYYWDVFVSMNASKHYFGNTRIREGNVYNEPELELKGTYLIGSNISKDIVDITRGAVKRICRDVTANKKIRLLEYIDEVKELERKVLERIEDHDISVFRYSKIEDASSYKNGSEESPYQQYILWKEVFEPKYGPIGEPPYGCVKVNTILHNKTALTNFVNGIEDLALRDRFIKWLARKKKTSLNVLHIPSVYASTNGLPDVILPVVDKKKIVLDSCGMYYMVLESIGYYKPHDRTVTEVVLS